MGKLTFSQMGYFSFKKKKSTGIILNICNGEMLEAEIE